MVTRTRNSKGLDTKTSNSTQTEATQIQQALTKTVLAKAQRFNRIMEKLIYYIFLVFLDYRKLIKNSKGLEVSHRRTLL